MLYITPQTWDFIPHDEKTDESAILIISSFKSGDLVGIPLLASKVKELKGVDGILFNYEGILKIADAELIPRVGKAN
jgi:hypothetical protein